MRFVAYLGMTMLVILRERSDRKILFEASERKHQSTLPEYDNQVKRESTFRKVDKESLLFSVI
ncbi:MAG: hypothetical protein ACUBOA_11825 [Candidatus Loosdrechtia sp.]|uniref:hypothetical protein n=1 Tax=Candidatus Loosdrechtia sp. TaxID=3101272 RepID=UPI003A761D5A|nr:MAG: hypothetical protein QY305_00630 [Candidatus Jettenia sp. AMX2]